MFVTLSVAPPKTRRKRNREPPLLIERIALPGAFSFYRMTVRPRGSVLPWNAVAAAAGSLRGRFLLPKGVTAPEGSGVGVFVPEKLPLFLLLNLAADVLAHRKVQAADVTVLDPAGVLSGRVERLVPFAGTLRVLTARPERYAEVRRSLLEEAGLSLCLAPPTAPLPERGVLLSLSAERVPRTFGGLLITGENRLFLHGETFAGRDVLLPPELEALRPPGIDRVQFASALEECCALPGLRELKYCTNEAGKPFV